MAFSGGHARGGFGAVKPQQDLQTLDAYLKRFGRIEATDPRLVRVQLLLYSASMQAPTAAEAKAWAEHFQLPNTVTLAAEPAMLGPEALSMIPGLQLIDKKGVLRVENSKRPGSTDLYATVLPMVGRLVNE